MQSNLNQALPTLIPILSLIWKKTFCGTSHAGYICRTVRNKLETGNSPNKDYLIFLIMEMAGDEEDEERERVITRLTEEACGMSVTRYNLFYAIERERRSHLQPSLATQLNADILFNSVMSNEDILFKWSIFGSDLDSDDGKVLIVRHYIKMWAFVELYKMENKNTLQKGKGLCKQLFTSTIK